MKNKIKLTNNLKLLFVKDILKHKTVFLHFMNGISGALSYLICTYESGLNLYGEFILSITIIWILGNINLFGMNNIIVMNLKEDTKQQKTIFRLALIVCTLLAALLTFIVLSIQIILNTSSLFDVDVTLCAVMYIFALNRIFLSQNQEDKNFAKYLRVNIIRVLVQNVFLCFFVANIFIKNLISVFLLTEIILLLYQFISKNKYNEHHMVHTKVKLDEITALFKLGLRLFLINLWVESLGKPEVLVVGFIKNPEMAGLLSLSISFAEMSCGIIWVRSLTLTPKFGFGRNNKQTYLEGMKSGKILQKVSAIMAILGLPVFLLMTYRKEEEFTIGLLTLIYLLSIFSRIVALNISLFNKVLIQFGLINRQNSFYILFHTIIISITFLAIRYSNILMCTFVILLTWIFMERLYKKLIIKVIYV